MNEPIEDHLDRPDDIPPRRSGRVGALLRRARRVLLWGLFAVMLLFLVWGLIYRWVNPPITFYMMQERARLGEIQYQWIDIEEVSPMLRRAVVAAEDANFCTHWGIDSAAVRQALREGALRGGSTISQQTIKNAFLWPGRNWLRKAVEALLTPYIELVWSKRRMLEIYLNIAEFDTGVFGIEAAAWHHFGVSAKDLSRVQAGRLAVVLPDPKGRSAIRPAKEIKKRAASVIAGADLIRKDGRAECFED
ncbi:MAG: monofunctional biosynthetic peptidoglycan transglycosylase [Rhodobacteraceae bacterium]|jgi:monofunctional biosynthetic peptidoglycan transglycosylase|nr:monofunctional biosynthetic peptidoglycan transglycosylase [Paracoccaceae bacterium]MBT6521140.1 monofunctional biosynthetic peptidoglycan transglycosylase [Paracoccaceae bacterium]MBT7342154.1 monofunctional biosynthetic peptidoglycan transglycosylase [Paracoccaceae bacterium]